MHFRRQYSCDCSECASTASSVIDAWNIIQKLRSAQVVLMPASCNKRRIIAVALQSCSWLAVLQKKKKKRNLSSILRDAGHACLGLDGDSRSSGLFYCFNFAA
jgi:hypothetical protein